MVNKRGKPTDKDSKNNDRHRSSQETMFDANQMTTCKYTGTKQGGDIQLGETNMVNGYVENEKFLILADSGATKTLISASTISRSKHLCKLERIPVKSTKFEIADGQHIQVDFAIKFNITIQEHTFEITALAVPSLGSMDIILGTKSLQEIGACLDFSNKTLSFKNRSILLKASRNTKIKPGESKEIELVGKLPSFIRNRDVIIRSSKFL